VHFKIEIAKLSQILGAIETETNRVGSELLSRGFRHYILQNSSLYIVYLDESDSGPYPIQDPYPWPLKDVSSLRSLLAIAANDSRATRVYFRGLLAARGTGGGIVLPAGRFDILLATRISTPLPSGHPALKTPRTRKAKSEELVLNAAGTYHKSRNPKPRSHWGKRKR
jgi:hypothetical protein